MMKSDRKELPSSGPRDDERVTPLAPLTTSGKDLANSITTPDDDLGLKLDNGRNGLGSNIGKESGGSSIVTLEPHKPEEDIEKATSSILHVRPVRCIGALISFMIHFQNMAILKK